MESGEINDDQKINGRSAKHSKLAASQNDEKAPDTSSDNIPHQKQPKPPTKPKKRKKPKDSTAPRHPLTGYVRYLNDRREAVRGENPSLTFADITKMLAGEWTNLPSDKKQQYLDAAELDRERYTKEYNAYKQTDAYKLFTQQQNDKKLKEMTNCNNNSSSNNKEEQFNSKSVTQQIVTAAIVATDAAAPPPPDLLLEFGSSNINNNFDIPIFTEEFLDHNKTRDAELRQLRKSNTDYEQQNAILQKHIENMKDAIGKMEVEIEQQEKNNASLQKHLDHLRVTLSAGFSGVKLPGMKEVATQNNIDSYMTNLHSILLENSSHDANLLQTVRNIVGRLEFNG